MITFIKTSNFSYLHKYVICNLRIIFVIKQKKKLQKNPNSLLPGHVTIRLFVIFIQWVVKVTFILLLFFSLWNISEILKPVCLLLYVLQVLILLLDWGTLNLKFLFYSHFLSISFHRVLRNISPMSRSTHASIQKLPKKKRNNQKKV